MVHLSSLPKLLLPPLKDACLQPDGSNPSANADEKSCPGQTRSRIPSATITLVFDKAADEGGLGVLNSSRKTLERAPHAAGTYILGIVCFYLALSGLVTLGAEMDVGSSSAPSCESESDKAGVSVVAPVSPRSASPPPPMAASTTQGMSPLRSSLKLAGSGAPASASAPAASERSAGNAEKDAGLVPLLVIPDGLSPILPTSRSLRAGAGAILDGAAASDREQPAEGSSEGSSPHLGARSSFGQWSSFLLSFCLPYIAIVAMALLSRAGTYRVQVAGGFAEYHHQETDERVFEALVQAVDNNWWDYSLVGPTLDGSGGGGRDVVAKLGLSPENYGDPLFIHPPLFVYSSMLLRRYLGLSLPSVSLAFHLGVLLLIPLLMRLAALEMKDEWKHHRRDRVHDLAVSVEDAATSGWEGKGGGGTNARERSRKLSPKALQAAGGGFARAFSAVNPPPATGLHGHYSVGAASLWATILFALDPLCFFSSQKFWIDNALMFFVTLSAVVHMHLWRREAVRRYHRGSPSRVGLRMATRALFSGVMYGVLVLNCKITGLALLPFMLMWMLVTALEVASVGRIVCCCFFPFLLGAVGAYAPWAILYQLRTGRLMPNAWPSRSLLATSAFVRSAVGKPPTYYAKTLLEFSPMQAVGALFGTLVFLRFAGKLCWQFLHCSSRKSRINGENIVPYGCSGRLCALSVWPLAFLAGLTLVGVLGGGFQSRFIVPIVPATSVLAAQCIYRAGAWSSSLVSSSSSATAAVYVLAALALAHAAVHCYYYGILFSNLYADLDQSALAALSGLLAAPYSPMQSAASMREMLAFLAHYGVNLKGGGP
jgi:hypothetical protein